MGAALAAPPSTTETFHVAQGFDSQSFNCQMELQSEEAAFRVFRLRYPSPVRTAVPQNNTIPAELYLPKARLPSGRLRPAVISLHIMDGNVELSRLVCTVLATRGVAALWFHLPYYGQRGPPSGHRALIEDPKLFTEALAQAVADVRRTVDVLAARPDIDRQHIGVMGISLGAILACTAAEKEPRLSRAAMLLGGGDVLKQVIHRAEEAGGMDGGLRRLPPAQRAAVEQAIEESDPLRHADVLRDRRQKGQVKLLMVNATEDEVFSRASVQCLADALGIREKIVWLEGLGHKTALAALPRVLKTTAVFFAEDLPSAGPPAVSEKKTSPQQAVVALLQQCGRFHSEEPSAGHCHIADLDVSVQPKDGKPYQGRLRLVRGPRPRFSLQGELAGSGPVSLGCGAYPWMAHGKVVFRGVLGTKGASRDAAAFADPRYVQRLDVFAGIAGAAALAPQILDRWVTIEPGPAEGNGSAVRIVGRGASRDFIRLAFQADGQTPRQAEFDIGGVRGTVTFRAWQLNAIAQDRWFQEPDGLSAKEVDREDLARMFAALFNLAVESIP